MAFKHLDLINSFLRGTNTTEVNEYFRGDIDESGYLDYKIGEETLKKYSIFRNLSTYLTVSKTDGKIIVPTSTDIAGVIPGAGRYHDLRGVLQGGRQSETADRICTYQDSTAYIGSPAGSCSATGSGPAAGGSSPTGSGTATGSGL